MAINDSGTVVGRCVTAGDNYHAFIWTQAGGMRELQPASGYYEAEAYAINAAGDIIGEASPYGTGYHAVLWPAGGGAMIDLQTNMTGYSDSTPEGINSAGQVVGEITDTSGSCHAFRWTSGSGMQLLALSPDAAFSNAYGINTAGQITGSMYVNGHLHAYRWSPYTTRALDTTKHFTVYVARDSADLPAGADSLLMPHRRHHTSR
jgi:probable HAF family extracellular repeat protein